MRADAGSARHRNSAGAEDVRPEAPFFQVLLEPLGGCMIRTLRTVSGATGMLHAVLVATALALRETLSVVSALAMLDSADDLVVQGGEGRKTRQGCCRKGDEDVARVGMACTLA